MRPMYTPEAEAYREKVQRASCCTGPERDGAVDCGFLGVSQRVQMFVHGREIAGKKAEEYQNHQQGITALYNTVLLKGFYRVCR